MIEISRDPLSPEAAINMVRKDVYGCVVCFTGLVRETSSSCEKVLYLELDVASIEVARRELQRIAEEIETRWQLEDIVICHRMGRLEVGESPLVVAIAAPHRREAFEACQYALDRFKEVVPMWEKEVIRID